jgi:L-seryl-tRNA(Ser) seleniumtransferase
LIKATKQIGEELRPLLGNRLRETPTTVQLPADDIVEIAMDHGGVAEPPIVPYEASAALSMLLLKDYDMLMVHFVGVPPGTADLLIKFVPPETLERFGGSKKYADAVNASLTKLGQLIRARKQFANCCWGPGGAAKTTVRPAGLKFEQPGYPQRSRRFQRRG